MRSSIAFSFSFGRESFIAIVPRRALVQSMAECDTLVEHETFAVPAALCFRRLFEIFQDAALKMVDFGKSLREQIGARFFAANAAGAEHRDPAMLLRIELLRDEILELSKARDA